MPTRERLAAADADVPHTVQNRRSPLVATARRPIDTRKNLVVLPLRIDRPVPFPVLEVARDLRAGAI